MAALLAFGAEARAQAEWDGFLIGGYTKGSLKGGSEELLGNETEHGFHAGALFQLRLADSYGVAVAVRYTSKGGGGSIDSTFAVVNFANVTRAVGNADITLDYIEIPLTFVALIDATDNSYFRAYLGPSVDILVRAHLKGDVEGEPIDQDIKSTLQSVQLSGTVGAGFVYEFASWRLMLDAHYWQGVTKAVQGADIKTRDFGAGIGVGIPLARSG
jgi:hypothetical protein